MKLFMAVFLFLCSINCYATELYVSVNTGDDSWAGHDVYGGAPNGPKATVQAAIDVAVAGDTIMLLPGVYYENIDMSGKNISLKSFNPQDLETVERTIISGNNSGCVITINKGESSSCTISGLTITGGYGVDPDEGGGIMCDGTSPGISYCIFRDNYSFRGGALYIKNSSPMISQCYFYGNSCQAAGGAIHVRDDSVTRIVNCVFHDNTASLGAAGTVIDSYVTIANCTIADNSSTTRGGAFLLTASSVVNIYNSILNNNKSAEGSELAVINNTEVTVGYSVIPDGPTELMLSDDSSVNWVSNNRAYSLKFYNKEIGDYRILEGTGVEIGTNTPPGGLPPVDIEGNLRIVDGDEDGFAVVDIGAYEIQPDSSYITVQTESYMGDPKPFVINAVEGDTSIITKYMYMRKSGNDTAHWDLIEHCSWLTPGATYGNIEYSFSYVPLEVDVTGMAAGFYSSSITLIVPNAVNYYIKVPVYLYISADPTIKNVPGDFATIQQAIDYADDGDMVVVAPGTYYENLNFKGKDITVRSTDPAQVSVVESTILNGTYGAGAVVIIADGETRDARLSGFTISHGKGGIPGEQNYYGGGVYSYNSSPTISHNIFRDNHLPGSDTEYFSVGGGICCLLSDAVVENNYFTENSALEGGGVLAYGGTVVRNNVIDNNTAYYSGGLAIYTFGVKAYNNTISSNTGDNYGGNVGIWYVDDDSYGIPTEVFNNIIVNAVSGGGVSFNGSVTDTSFFSYNNVWNNGSSDYVDISSLTGIHNNISVDPLFADGYHLSEESPCISAGKPDHVPDATELDLDLEAREYALRVDMGADEYVGYVNPVASAGYDLFVDELSEIRLDGTSSFIMEGYDIFYYWNQISGPTVELSTVEDGVVSFIPVEEGEYVFELVVSDGAIYSIPDTVTVVIGNRIPVAVVGANLAVEVGDRVYLDGSGSYDLDMQDELSYSWSQVSGPAVVLNDSSSAVAWFDCTVGGKYEFELQVSDSDDVSMPVMISVMTVELTSTFWERDMKIDTTDYYHYPDANGRRVVYSVGDNCDYTWNIKCLNFADSSVITLDGESGAGDNRARIDGDTIVWYGTGISWGNPWYHEPSNSSIFAYDLNARRKYTLRKYTWGESYSHPSISGKKVVWLEHLGIDPRPTDSDQAVNWYNTPYNICGADISDLSSPKYFTIAQNVGNRDPYPCYDYSYDFNEVVDIYGNLVVWEAEGDIYGADISDLNNIVVFPVCTDSGTQLDPAISGTMVVWQDCRNDSGDIYGADISDINNIKVVPLVEASGIQEQPAIDGNIIGYCDNDYIKFACYISGYSVIPIDLGENQYTGMGIQIGTAPRMGNHFAIWQTSAYGEAEGVFISCNYSVADGPVENVNNHKQYDTIQNALYDAAGNDVIQIQPGTYYEDMVFLGNNNTVRSIPINGVYDPSQTVFAGSGHGPVITFNEAPETDYTIEGITISGAIGYDEDGGGAVVSNSSTPTFRHCVISDNNAVAGAAVYADGGGLTLDNCLISGNNSVVGGALYLTGSCEIDFRNSVFSRNQAFNGGMIGGYYCTGNITNCTIADNSAVYFGGAIYCKDSCHLEVADSILSGNTAEQGQNVYSMRNSEYSRVNISYSDLVGGPDSVLANEGTYINLLDGVIDVDPMFTDPDAGDYHLKSEAGRWDGTLLSWVKDDDTSMCIDAGDPESDCSNELWPHGGRVNYGAYGATAQASMSNDDLVGNAADLNRDNTVDLFDFTILTERWLIESNLDTADISRDGIVDQLDMVGFAQNWLWSE